MFSVSLFSTITKPKQITSRAATLIEGMNEEAISGILYTDIYDHYPVFFIDHSFKKIQRCRHH